MQLITSPITRRQAAKIFRDCRNNTAPYGVSAVTNLSCGKYARAIFRAAYVRIDGIKLSIENKKTN